MTTQTVQQKGDEVNQCIENCLDCHRICLETVAYCLQMGGKHAEAAHIRLLLDCAEICQTSANFMMRGSNLHGYVCGVCAVICERCAESCERMGDDERMRVCAQECRTCADSCRQMAQAVA
ncbi:MAG TPA: four-helix bundle copper-binding protein [Blastocatellia bacterium]|nr:four-helix bundle copper-binding protein [Blastocatellia bacterium]